MQYFEAQRDNGGRLIVADPRFTATAESATLHLRLTPGSDAALANGLLHVLIGQSLIDADYIESRTEGFDRVKGIAATYWPERVERITGVPEADGIVLEFYPTGCSRPRQQQMICGDFTQSRGQGESTNLRLGKTEWILP